MSKKLIRKRRRTSCPPLQGPSETGFYTYKGKPLTQEELDLFRNEKGLRIPEKPFRFKLEDKFVYLDPDYESHKWDIMPDNRLKLAKFRSDWDPAEARKIEFDDNEEYERWMAERRAEWVKLPSPKPMFPDWLVAEHSDRIIGPLLRRVMMNTSDQGVIAATRTLLEFTKQKPKTVTESTSDAVVDESTLIDLVLKVVDKDKLLARLQEPAELDETVQ